MQLQNGFFLISKWIHCHKFNKYNMECFIISRVSEKLLKYFMLVSYARKPLSSSCNQHKLSNVRNVKVILKETFLVLQYIISMFIKKNNNLSTNSKP